jgi:hypothetical protein
MSATAVVGDEQLVFTQKERLLMDAIRQTFDELGPEAIEMMKIIVNKSKPPPNNIPNPNHLNQPPQPPQPPPHPQPAEAAEEGGKKVGDGGAVAVAVAVAPSLRAIERFFLRLNDSEVAFWRVRPSSVPLVPAEVCATDILFRNDHHVTPVHVFASLKRMATQWQKRYVDNFGRRTKAVDFDVPTTICQANCFGWLFSEQILHRLRLLAPIHAYRFPVPPPATLHSRKRHDSASQNEESAISKRQKNNNEVPVEIVTSPPPPPPPPLPAKGAKRPKELYLYDYPRYISRPPSEGCGIDDPLQPLPLMASTPEVVERHYLNFVERLLYTTSLARTDPHHHRCYVSGTEQLPYMIPATTEQHPVKPQPHKHQHKQQHKQQHKTTRQKKDMVVVMDTTTADEVENDGTVDVDTGLPLFLFETVDNKRTFRPSSMIFSCTDALPVMAQDHVSSSSSSSSSSDLIPEAGLARVDVAKRARGSGLVALSEWIALEAETADQDTFAALLPQPPLLQPPVNANKRRRRSSVATKRGSALFSSISSSSSSDDDDDDDNDDNEAHDKYQNVDHDHDTDKEIAAARKRNNPSVALVDIFRNENNDRFDD